MKVSLPSKFLEALGEEQCREFGVELRSFYREEHELNLPQMHPKQVTRLQELARLEKYASLHGVRTLVGDLKTWHMAQETDPGAKKCGNVKAFSVLVTEFLRKVPGHRVYQKLDAQQVAAHAYYVDNVEYHKATKSGDYYSPAYVDIDILWDELGRRHSASISWYTEDVRGKTAAQAFVAKGYLPETDELRAEYLATTNRFQEVVPDIGIQYLTTGHVTGMKSSRDVYDLTREKVVLDIFSDGDGDSSSSSGGSKVTYGWWQQTNPFAKIKLDADFNPEYDPTEDADVEVETTVEIPIHPYVAVFELRRKLRYKTHVSYVTKYVYDDSMGDKLILDQTTKDLVQTLIDESKTDFDDIVAGKGQGVAILLTGIPGVGKTLTAEVFAEASHRPLYTIQAAQLGMTAEKVEQNLNAHLRRVSRWGAVCLIDEADVYIRQRDTDMEHNAIVAAFLRILEYQSAILFMTTNMAHSVDDAIASRCIARVDYQAPTREQQAEIWKVLAASNDIVIPNIILEKIGRNHPNLTGRDIKQLLKLSSMVTTKRGGKLTVEVIDFVAKFQPTIGQPHKEKSDA